MESQSSATAAIRPVSPWTGDDVAGICRANGWLAASDLSTQGDDLREWFSRAAALLGPHAEDRESLSTLLRLIFEYDAAALHREAAVHALLTHTGARDVLREFARLILAGTDVDSDRFKQILDEMKAAVPVRGVHLFHPIRRALTGREGDGKLDRVILLLDSASRLPFAVPVKGTRQRMLEFCGHMD
jgi:hypothetical protein